MPLCSRCNHTAPTVYPPYFEQSERFCPRCMQTEARNRDNCAAGADGWPIPGRLGGNTWHTEWNEATA